MTCEEKSRTAQQLFTADGAMSSPFRRLRLRARLKQKTGWETRSVGGTSLLSKFWGHPPSLPLIGNVTTQYKLICACVVRFVFVVVLFKNENKTLKHKPRLREEIKSSFFSRSSQQRFVAITFAYPTTHRATPRSLEVDISRLPNRQRNLKE